MAVAVKLVSEFDPRGFDAAERRLNAIKDKALAHSDSMAGSWMNAGSSIVGFGDSISQTGARITGVGDKLTSSVTMPLAGIGGLAFKTAADFEQSMNLVQAASGATGDQMGQLEEMAKKFGAETVFSANESAQAMLELAKSGMTPAQIAAGGLEASLQLAAAGQLSLESAAMVTANSINMFGLEAADAAMVADALAGGANASSASVDSLQQALSQVGPGAKLAGLSLNDTVGVLAAFADRGLQGSDAGTSLKTMLTRLVPQTDSAAEAMQAMGLSFVDANGNIDDITVVAQKLQDRLGGLSEAERSQALATMFGSDATRAAAIMMELGADKTQEYIDATNDREAAERMADAAMKGSKGSIEEMMGSLETAALTIGQALTPRVIEVADKVGALADKFSNLDEDTQKTIVNFALAVAAAGPVLSVVGRVTNVVGGLTQGVGLTVTNLGRFAGGFKGLDGATATTAGKLGGFASKTLGSLSGSLSGVTGVFGRLGGIITGHPLLMLAGVVIGLATAFGIAYNKSDGFREMVDGIGQKIRDFMANLPAMIEQFTTALPGLVTNIVEGITSAVDGFVANIGTFVNGLTTMLPQIVQAGVTLFTGLVTGLTQVIPALIGVIPTIVTSLVTAITTLVPALVGALTTMVPALVQGFVTLLMALATAIPQILPPLVTGITTLITQMVGMLPTLIPVLINGALSLLMAIVQAVPQILPPLLTGVVGLITSVVEMLPTLIPVLLDAALTLLMAIVDAIPVILPQLLDAALGLIMTLVGMLPTLIPVLLDAALTLVMAIVNAVPIILPQLLDAAVNVVMAVVKMLPSLIGSLITAAVSLFMGIVKAVPQVVGALIKAQQSLIRSAIDVIPGFIGEMVSAGGDLIQGLIRGVTNGVGALKTAVTNAARSALNAAKDFLGIKSPSREFSWIGDMTMLGWQGAILGGAGGVVSAVSATAAAAMTAADAELGRELNISASGTSGAQGSGQQVVNHNTYYQIGNVTVPADDPAMQDAIKTLLDGVKRYSRMQPQGA